MTEGEAEESVASPSDAPLDAPSDDLRSLASGAGLTLLGRVCGRGAALLGSVAVARWLGPETFGLYGIGWALVTFLYFLGPLGLDRGVVHFLARDRDERPAVRKGILVQSLGLSLITGSGFALLLLVGAGWLEDHVFKAPGLAPIVRGFALLIPLATGLRVAAGTTTASRSMKYSVITEELIAPVGSLLLILLLLSLGWGVQGAVAANVIATGAAFLVALAFVRRLFRDTLRPGLEAPRLTRRLLAFSLPASLAGVLTALTLRVDRLVLGYFRPPADVGSYLAAAQLTMVLALGASGFHAILAPLVADLYHRRETERLARVYRTATRWSFYVVSPVFLICVLDGRRLLTAVFGADFTAGAAAVVLLATMQLVCVLGGGAPYLLVMSGNQRYWAVLSAPAFVLNVLLDLLLIPRFGLVGAAVASLVSLSALFIAGVVTAGRLLGLWPLTGALWKGVAASGVGAAALVAADQLLPLDGLPGLLWRLTAASVGIFGSLLLLAPEDDDRELLRILRARLRGTAATPPLSKSV